MPIYMDAHIISGVKAKDVAEAHTKDLIHQHEYGCKCMTYWTDEEREKVFCLIEAPDKDAVRELHKKSHGLIPNKIIEVSSKVVQSFLGRLYDPEDVESNDEGLKIFNDSSFRILLVVKIIDSILLQHELGSVKANELLLRLRSVVKKSLSTCGGSSVEYAGAEFVVSFTSAATAISCASSITENLTPEDVGLLDLKIAINAGDPIEKSNKLFGDVIQQAANMCMLQGSFRVAVCSSIKDLVANTDIQNKKEKFRTLSPHDESLLRSLFSKLEENFGNCNFDIADYGKAMAMSMSQLYRKTLELTGMSPNQLLKDYRLAKAKELMKQKPYSISQISFDTGFTSPSYFTKCFKLKYGLLPKAYLDMLQ
ncbi:nickel-binding protein [Segetibacter aerophilus]|uniref:HTH araC/xylS-type domain-containing protein n=1 Tax=Segetibacter aerophilus TaxID=670293 RepID=A0A512B9R7_9BACT|nr:nickel-binding protein [Segetibacter aerophilus]GEO08689.1 hypothetical protein SAE01_11850 [Segetibacter aerophilus]